MAPVPQPGSLPIQSPPPGAPPYPPYPPYGPPVPPYYPPPQRGSSVLVIVVVVVIVIVLVTVVLAAIMFVLVGGLIGGGPPDGRPFVTFGTPSLTASEASFPVAGASRSAPAGSFLVNLFVNDTVGVTQPLGSSFTITVGSDAYPGSYLDVDGGGLLTRGDGFRITAPGGWAIGATYQFELLWSDGSPVGFVSWTT